MIVNRPTTIPHILHHNRGIYHVVGRGYQSVSYVTSHSATTVSSPRSSLKFLAANIVL
jgi:hypothetical protein